VTTEQPCGEIDHIDRSIKKCREDTHIGQTGIDVRTKGDVHYQKKDRRYQIEYLGAKECEK
jgi:hypothetical protein